MSDQMQSAKHITHQRLMEKGWDPLQKPVRRVTVTKEDIDGPGSRVTIAKEDNDSSGGSFLELEKLCIIGADFSDLDLRFAKFTCCDLSSVNFDRCNLFKATFEKCTLYNATFDKAVLVDINFRGSYLFGIRLKHAEIHGMGFQGIIEDLICREPWDGDGSLAFRGTAGLKECELVHSYCGDKDSFFKPLDHLPEIPSGHKDSKLIAGVNASEIVEICPLYSGLLQDRREELENGIPLNLPNPLGDAFPEDSTGMMLRSFRQCFEEQGRKYSASCFRFWETTYLTASKWRTIQAKILQARTNEHCSRLRSLLAWFPALVAWSLLHPCDERRSSAIWGRKQSTRGSLHVAGEVKVTIWTRLKDRINGGSLISVIIHTIMLLAFFAPGLYLFVQQSDWRFGLGLGLCWVVALFGIPTCYMKPEKHSKPAKKEETEFFNWQEDDLRDVYRATFEFMQHITCGHGERPWRAIGVLFGWVILFGVLYSFIPELKFNNTVGTDFGPRFDQSLYFSIVSATTLGFGEITPDSLRLQRLVCVEVIGAVMLTAIFLASLTRKLIGR